MTVTIQQNDGTAPPPPPPPPKPACKARLRSACDACHQSKIKCNGANPCRGCHKTGSRCKYSSSNRHGRPRGARNKKTLQRLLEEAQAGQDAAVKEGSGQLPSPCGTPDGSRQGSEGTIVTFDDFDVDTYTHSDFSDDLRSTEFLPGMYVADSSGVSLESMSHDVSSAMAAHEPHGYTLHTPYTICDCLQHLAAQFVQFKIYSQASPPVPQAAMAISYLREGIAVWNQYLECADCSEASSDSDVLVLVVMQIRMILPVIERAGHDPMQAPPVDGTLTVIETLLAHSLEALADVLRRVRERGARAGLQSYFPTEYGFLGGDVMGFAGVYPGSAMAGEPLGDLVEAVERLQGRGRVEIWGA